MDSFDFTQQDADDALPFIVRPRGNVALSAAITRHRYWLDERLHECGAVLFRGFHVPDQTAFQQVVRSIAPQPLAYRYRSTPRTTLGEGIYTATEYPAHQRIPLHNENAYQRSWPMVLMFFCVQPAQAGGETPLARTARITARLDPACIDVFTRNHVRYVRNYRRGVDLPWQTVFQTDDCAAVEAFCAEHGISCCWDGEDLRTEQVRPALASHPRTGQRLWFNQAHLFHVSALDTATRTALQTLYKDSELPRNAYYGDGSSLDETMLEDVRRAYDAEVAMVSWQAGDLLVLDNMLVCHGRNPYKGSRRLLLAMGRPSDAQQPQ